MGYGESAGAVTLGDYYDARRKALNISNSLLTYSLEYGLELAQIAQAVDQLELEFAEASAAGNLGMSLTDSGLLTEYITNIKFIAIMNP